MWYEIDRLHVNLIDCMYITIYSLYINQIKSNQIKSKDFIVPNTLSVYGPVLQ